MKIKMLTLMAGPQGVRQIGKVYQVPDEEGKMLIQAHAAVQADPKTRLEPVQPITPERVEHATGKGARRGHGRVVEQAVEIDGDEE